MTHRLRRSARVFLFDEHDRLLLIRFVAQREGGPCVFWVTPGGEIEPNEERRTAAARELHEELGIAPPLVGPVHQEAGGTYVHLGETVENHDTFFAARTTADAPKLAGVTAAEIALIQEARWWSAAELAATAERIYPPQIATLLPDILAALRVAETKLPGTVHG
jgi:8-oxo-dGTP pyrophosphatase MutT (NUDIX family)